MPRHLNHAEILSHIPIKNNWKTSKEASLKNTHHFEKSTRSKCNVINILAATLAISLACNQSFAQQPSPKSSMFSFFKSKPTPEPVSHLGLNNQFKKALGMPSNNELTREELLKSGEGTFKVTLTSQGFLEKIEGGSHSFQGYGYALPSKSENGHWIASFVEPGDPRTMFVARQSTSNPVKTDVAQPIKFPVMTTKNAGTPKTLPHFITEVGAINEYIALVRIAQHMNIWQSGLYTLDLRSLETQTIQKDGINSTAGRPGIYKAADDTTFVRFGVGFDSVSPWGALGFTRHYYAKEERIWMFSHKYPKGILVATIPHEAGIIKDLSFSKGDLYLKTYPFKAWSSEMKSSDPSGKTASEFWSLAVN